MSFLTDKDNENQDFDEIEDILSLVHVSRNSLNYTEQNNLDSKFPIASKKSKINEIINSEKNLKNKENKLKFENDCTEDKKHFKDMASKSEQKFHIFIDFKKYFSKSLYKEKFKEIKNKILDDMLYDNNGDYIN